MKINWEFLSLLLILGLTSCGETPTTSDFSTTSDVPTTIDPTTVEPTTEDSTSDPEPTTVDPTTEDPSTSEDPFTTDEPTTSEETSSTYSYEDYFDGYYDSLLSWENSEDLLNKIEDLRVSTITPLPYAGNWTVCQNSSQSLSDFNAVDVVYSEENDLKTNTFKNASGWQREHAFPASLMTGKTTSEATQTLGIATDYHNLWASYLSGNTSRGNKNYGLATDQVSKVGDCTFNEKNFEPNDIDKGKLTRSIFYIASSYRNSDGIFLREEINTDLNVRAHGNLSVLLNWNTSFDVDRFEYQHNEVVFKEQGNRNPFVDFPELVDYCFGTKMNEGGSILDLVPSAYRLNFDDDSHANYAISERKDEFYVGEVFSKNDMKYVDILNDFSYVEYTPKQVILLNIDEGHVFSDEEVTQSKFINLKIDGERVSIKIKILSSSVENSTYYYNVVRDDFLVLSAGNVKTLTLNNVEFNGYIASGAVKGLNKEKGLQIGTSTDPCTLFYLESKNDFAYSDLSQILSVYFRGNVASGTTAKFKVYINDNLVINETLKYDSTGSNTINGKVLSSPMTGKLKIEISEIQKALYIRDFGINLA